MSRKTNRDHAKRQQRPMMEDEAISAQISALLTPALAKQKKYCRQLACIIHEEKNKTKKIRNGHQEGFSVKSHIPHIFCPIIST